MDTGYDKNIDKKWQEIWEKEKCFKTKEDYNMKKWYSLVEFPYPSGAGMHVGHIRAYMSMDVISRLKRMQGYNVLFPIGFDAFGLPTENYAIKNNIHPRIVTDNNVGNFTRQLKSVGYSFDWDRVIDTTDEGYYKWTQWIFLKLFEKGLAYKSKTFVNYCPKCRVILANEESQGGVCDRCDSEVVQKEKEVWMLKITDYADKLLEGLDEVDFPPRVRLEQENWIGKSYGAEVTFKLVDENKNELSDLKIYTTRPDTIYGVTFMVIAPEHDILKELESKITNIDEVKAYIEESMKKSELERTKEASKEKTGVILQGVKALNPITGEIVPVLVADYVMLGYGTGAIMAVPAHDDRDFETAIKFNIPIKQVIAKSFVGTGTSEIRKDKPMTERNVVNVVVKHPTDENKFLCVNNKKFNWINFVMGGIEQGESAIDAAIRELKEETGYTDIAEIQELPLKYFDNFYAAHKDVNRHITCSTVIVKLNSLEQVERSEEEKEIADIIWIDRKELEEKLWTEAHKYDAKRALYGEGPMVDDGVVINSDFLNGLHKDEAMEKMIEYMEKEHIGVRKTNYHMKDWAFARQRYWGEPLPIIKCPHCGLVPLKEEELPLKLPEVKDFMPGEDGESPLAKIDSWVNVKCPKCGQDAKRETDTMPQWAGSSWYFLRYLDPKNDKTFASEEALKYWLPVDQYNGGMEHVTRHLIYSRFWHRFLYDNGLVPTREPYAKRSTQGLILAQDGSKMSKSKGNVVNPDDIVREFGADTLRTYILFIGEYAQSAPWSDEGVKGVKKFLDRVARLENLIVDEDIESRELESELHAAIKKVTEDYVSMKFNTAIACMMSYVNILYKQEKISKKYVMPLLQILNPVAPHITEEMWQRLGGQGYLLENSFPTYDEAKIQKDEVEMAIMIKGKVKFKIMVPSTMTEEEIEEVVRNDERLYNYVEKEAIQKIIVIKGRMVNIVAS